MVDDILSIQKCQDAKKINATINAFIEIKKFTLSHKKCNRIQVVKSKEVCPDLKVHESEMKNSERKNILGTS